MSLGPDTALTLHIKQGGDRYQRAAMRTAGPGLDSTWKLINACLGLSGEAGEFCDRVKKEMFHNHDTDPEKLKSELGDIAWYLALACEALNLSFGDVLIGNISKLKARYPDGFDSERSRNRTDNAGASLDQDV